MGIDLKNLSDDDRQKLMEQLAKEEKAKRVERNKRRKIYEKNREKRIQKSIKGLLRVEKIISEFKDEISEMMAQQHLELDEFGLIPTKSKGGFSILSNDGNFKITRTRDTDPKWDETALKGAQIIKEFLIERGEFSGDQETQQLLMSLLQKNDQGDLEFSKVMILLQHEDTYQDTNWKEGLKLLKEGYHVEFKKFGYQFFKKDSEGKFKPVIINFSNL